MLCVILSVLALILGLRLLWMRKAAEEIRRGFSEKLEMDTNTLISISSRDRQMRLLAKEINIQLGELRKQRLRYIQGDFELKNAVTNISHDLRTPLTAINAYLDLLEGTDKSPEAERYIAIIKNRTQALGQFSEELFQYLVITSPEKETRQEEVTVNHVLEESILGYYAVLQEKNIIPQISITEKRVTGQFDRASLSRIFSNLLNNAIKYSDGDLKITLTDRGEIIFSNRAKGLERVQVERLFDRFYTVENARKSTGLGLSISKILVEEMGGTIAARYIDGMLVISIQLPGVEHGKSIWYGRLCQPHCAHY